VETTRLRLHVVPRAAKEGVIGRYGEAWKVRVSAAPDRGEANAALLEILASVLGVRPRDVRIVSGHASRDKIVEVAGVGPHDTEARLASATRKDA
jgi:uncharacterized protein